MTQSPFMTADDVFRWMERTCAPGMKPGLERMNWVLKRLGHPERRLKWIHVAGTNGKGSTGAMIAQVLRQAGYTTGMFSSPHIMNWNERVQLDGQPIEEEVFVRWANHLKPLIEEVSQSEVGRPTPFEFWTLLAILYFAREAVPWFVVWEAGLGGKFDSTNVVYPLVSVITNVSREHTKVLGDSISAIASEKAGIIKPGVPVVTGCEAEEAYKVLAEEAQRKKSHLYQLHRDFHVELLHGTEEGQTIRFSSPFSKLDDLSLSLVGPHQVKNAAVALMTLEVLRQFYATVLEEEDIRAGISATHWPGRLEKMGSSPHIVLDGAHNPAGARALAEAIPKLFTYRRLHLLLSILEDKEAEGILDSLLPLADRVIVTKVDHPRYRPVEKLINMIQERSPDLPVQALDSAIGGLEQLQQEATSEDLILVTGSLFLVSEIRQHLLKQS